MTYYHRTSRVTPLAISQREPTGAYPPANHIRYKSPTRDADADRTNSRRRIAVACARCRKRKIKCSGDPGNGRGCSNCKSAGSEPGQCQFLRVNSGSLECAALPQLTTDWPYLVSGLGGAPSFPIGSSLGHYSSSNNSVPSLASASYPGANSFGGHRLPRYSSSNGCLGGSYSAMPPTLPGDYYANFGGNDGLVDSYGSGTNTIQHPVGGSDAHLSAAIYGSPEISRPWVPASSSSRGPATYDLDYPNRFTTTSSSYGSTLISSGPDTSSVFPAMGALANCLPLPPLSDRSLPDPRLAPSLDTNPTSSQIVTGDSSSLFPTPTSNLGNAAPWTTDRVAATGSHLATATSSSGAIVSGGNSKSSTSSPDIHETAFGYGSKQDTSPSNDNVETTPEYFSMPSGSILRSQLHSSNSYTHCMGSPKPATEGTLVNGQIYTPYSQVEQTPDRSQRAPSIDLHRRQSGEITARSTPRISVASSGTSRR